MNRSTVYGVFIVVALSTGFALLLSLTTPGSNGDLSRQKAPSPGMEAEYFAGNETVVITVNGSAGEFNRSNTLQLYVKDRAGNLTVKAERRVVNGHWLSINRSSAASYPVNQTGRLWILSDGVDDDGDGITGIDGNETLELVYSSEGEWENYQEYPARAPLLVIWIENSSLELVKQGDGEPVIDFTGTGRTLPPE
ncbi:MAG: hypothetical protein ABEJ07_01725 [Candidatus Nanohaloarchaea archaeon]